MKKYISLSLAAALLLACALGGCAQSKSVSVGVDGIVASKDVADETPVPSPTLTDSPSPTPTPTPEPTPTPVEVPGWFYHYDLELINQDNVLFTLQSLEYDYDAKTLRVVVDYTNTGIYGQLIVCIYAIINNTSYTLNVDPATTSDTFIYLKAGELRPITFSYEFTDEDLASFDLQHAKTIGIEMFKLEASDPSEPNNFTIKSFDSVNVELPPAV